MKSIIAILIPFILFSFAKGQAMASIDDFKWENRIIIVGVSGSGDPYVASLNESNPGIVDRDIVWFVVDSEGVRSNLASVDERLEKSVKSFLVKEDDKPEVILIGKDGGVKNRSVELDMDALFEQIDAMPMRIREMKNQ
jgi:hypothetical protein